MEPLTIDQVRLNFNPQGLMVINAAIGLMMLGVSLDLKLDDFKRILVSPKAPGIGLAAQFILLPTFTFLLTLVLKPHPSMALGMILVAACPGGNLSNIMTYLAKGNCAVSISMTAISTVAAIFMTPLNLSIWGGLNPATADILRKVSLSPVDVFITVFLILGIPLIVGQVLTRFFPNLADRVRRPFKIFSLAFFLVIICGALAANWSNFISYVGVVMLAVYFVRLERYVVFRSDQLRPRLDAWKRILRVGLPPGGEFALLSSTWAWSAGPSAASAPTPARCVVGTRSGSGTSSRAAAPSSWSSTRPASSAPTTTAPTAGRRASSTSTRAPICRASPSRGSSTNSSCTSGSSPRSRSRR